MTGLGIGGHASARARSRVWLTAAHHIAPPHDGLAAAWAGRVWCNPPYGREVGAWLDKLAAHANGTALTFARTETSWFAAHVWPKATAVLFISGRLHFYRPDGTRAEDNCGGPSCLIAYSDHDATALEHADIAGTLVRLHHTGTPAAVAARTAHTRPARCVLPELVGPGPVGGQGVLDFTAGARR